MPNDYSSSANTTSSLTNIGPPAAVLDLNVVMPTNAPAGSAANEAAPSAAPFGTHIREAAQIFRRGKR